MTRYLINRINPIDKWYPWRKLFEGKVMNYYPAEGKYRFARKIDSDKALKHLADNETGFLFIGPTVTEL
jgi:hypothetical protein